MTGIEMKKGEADNESFSNPKYKILEETDQPDGSIMVKIIKQYNSSPVGNYLDKVKNLFLFCELNC